MKLSFTYATRSVLSFGPEHEMSGCGHTLLFTRSRWLGPFGANGVPGAAPASEVLGAAVPREPRVREGRNATIDVGDGGFGWVGVFVVGCVGESLVFASVIFGSRSSWVRGLGGLDGCAVEH
jgi:hypothetical protein